MHNARVWLWTALTRQVLGVGDQERAGLELDHASHDLLRGHVDDREVLGNDHWPVIAGADAVEDRLRGTRRDHRMEAHRDAGPGLTEDLRRSLRRGVLGPGHDLRLNLGPAKLVHVRLRRVEDLMNQDVYVLRVLDGDRAGLAVAGEDHAQVAVVEPVAHGAVDAVRHREGRHLDAVFVVDLPCFVRLELMRLHLESALVQVPKLGAVVPRRQLVDVVDEGFDAQLGLLAAGAVDVHRLQPAVGLPEVVVDDQVGDVVDVIVGDEDLRRFVVWHPHVVKRRVGACARIEDEYVPVSQLDHEPGAALASPGGIARPEGRDAHLLLCQGLRPCDVQVRVLLELGLRILDYHPLCRKRFGAVRLR